MWYMTAVESQPVAGFYRTSILSSKERQVTVSRCTRHDYKTVQSEMPKPTGTGSLDLPVLAGFTVAWADDAAE